MPTCRLVSIPTTKTCPVTLATQQIKVFVKEKIAGDIKEGRIMGVEEREGYGAQERKRNHILKGRGGNTEEGGIILARINETAAQQEALPGPAERTQPKLERSRSAKRTCAAET